MAKPIVPELTYEMLREMQNKLKEQKKGFITTGSVTGNHGYRPNEIIYDDVMDTIVLTKTIYETWAGTNGTQIQEEKQLPTLDDVEKIINKI